MVENSGALKIQAVYNKREVSQHNLTHPLSSGMQGYYLASSRELTRLDSITKAPIIHHFSETITGVMTIRSFRKQGMFCQENIDRVNANLRMDFHNNGSNEWLGFRLEFIGSIVLCIATMFMVLLPSNIIKPGNAIFISSFMNSSQFLNSLAFKLL